MHGTPCAIGVSRSTRYPNTVQYRTISMYRTCSASTASRSHPHWICLMPVQIDLPVLMHPPIHVSNVNHRLGWNRLGYGETTEELRVPCDHLEKLHFCAHQY